MCLLHHTTNPSPLPSPIKSQMKQQYALALTTLALVALVATCSATVSLEGDNDGFIITPFGRWPKECVHHAHDGSHIHNEDEHFVIDHEVHGKRRVARCQSPLLEQVRKGFAGKRNGLGDDEGDGWQQYVHQQVGNDDTNVTSLLGNWNVPANPSEQAQILYMFTGLQNIDWVPPQPQPYQNFDIIQPVLQFGYGAAGGGGYWAIASWYVTLGSDVVYTTLKTVNVGDNIFGNMTKLNDNGTWFINTVDVTTGTQTPLTITRSLLTRQPWTYVTLEVYEVEDCGQYPPSGTELKFTKLSLTANGKQVTPQWTVGTDGQDPPVCGSSIDILSPTDVTITF